jgi:hypothetical protein
VAFVACGSKTALDGGGTDSSTTALDGGGTDSSTTSPTDAGSPDVRTHPNPDDASTTIDTGPLPVCTRNGGGAGRTGDSCSVSDEEVCDGVMYAVTCRCPEATCTCSGASVVLEFTRPFKGCPSCPSPATGYEACGYPH